MELGPVEIALGKSILGLIELLTNQGGFFLFVQRCDFLDERGVARVVGVALQVIEITRQSATLLRWHVAVHQGVELAYGGLGGGADDLTRSNAGQIERAQN